MLPGIGGIAGKTGGLVNLFNTVNTSSETIVSGGGVLIPSYSAIEFIAECGSGGGYARSYWLSGAGGAPAVGATVAGLIDRRSGSPPIEATITVNGVTSVQALASSANGGNVTNNGTGGTAFRVQVNYIP